MGGKGGGKCEPMWIGLARQPQGRCLIPLTGFAEPAGPKGSKTRTWVTVKGLPIFTWGGLWRGEAEWGPVLSGGGGERRGADRPARYWMTGPSRPAGRQAWLHGVVGQRLRF